MARLGPVALFTIVTVMLALGAGVARAAPRVAVLPMDFEGRVPEASRVSLNERLVEGLAGAGFEVSAGEVLKQALSGGPDPDHCRARDCYKVIARKLALEFLVIAELKIKERNYDLKLQLVGKDGKPAADARETCELCGLQEVGEKLDNLAASLMSHAGRRSETARLMVQSQPAGALVTIDGREAGETPLSLDLNAGAHEVAFSARGYADSRKKVTLDGGVRGLVSVDLMPMPVTHTGVIKAHGAARDFGILTMGIGLVAAAAGATILAVADHKPVPCMGQKIPDDPTLQNVPHCYRNAKLPAGILIGAGGSALISGGLVLFVDWNHAAPAPGDAAHAFAVGARGSF